MSKKSPWYSIEPGRDVYHDETECTEGNNIETKNLRHGTDGRRKCDHCRRISG